VPDQAPFALVLGCSDARVPIESVFDQSFNDLFVIRIAGNVLGTECIGSFDYAVRQFGGSLQAVVVLGHTGCGAVTAAVSAYLSPTDFTDIALTHPLRTLIDRIMIAVRGAANAFDRQCGRDFQQASLVSRRLGGGLGLLERRHRFVRSAARGPRRHQQPGESLLRRLRQSARWSCTTARRKAKRLPPSLASAPPDTEAFVALTDQIIASIVKGWSEHEVKWRR